MLVLCSRFSAVRVWSSQRTAATAPRSLFDLVSGTAKPLVEDEVMPVSRPKRKIDFIRSTISASTSTTQLFQVIAKHCTVMNGSHVHKCWEKLDSALKFGSDPEILKQHKGFDDLLEVTCTRINLMHPGQLVEILRIAANLQIDANSELVRSTCGSVKHRLNKCSLHDLVMFAFFLTKFHESSGLVEILRLSIPVIFQARVRSELEKNDPELCYRLLLHTLVERTDEETCELVAEAALKTCGKFTLPQAFNILRCAAHTKALNYTSPSYREILRTCMDVITFHTSELEDSHIEIILRFCHTYRMGSKVLFDFFWSCAPTKPFEWAVSLLKTSLEVDYLSLPAAELAMNLVLDNKDQVIGDINVMRLAEAVASVALHYDKNSDQGQRALQAGRILADAHLEIDEIVESRPNFLAQISLCLGIIGVFPRERLNLLFDERFQQSLCRFEMSYIYLYELEQILNLTLGESNPYRTLPELKSLVECRNMRTIVPRSLTEILEIALGGKQFLASKVQTPLGIQADYIVAMRKGGYAVALSGVLPDPFEKLPPESKVVAILVERDDRDKFTHTGMRKLRFSLRERLLQAQNISTLVINLEKFESLLYRERTPFVMKSLREVLQDGPTYTDARVSKFSAKW